MSEIYDFIIVGAGSAGCVLAYRLSENPAHRVLLLEAGGIDSSYLIHMPKGFAKLVKSSAHTWYFPVQQPREPGLASEETWLRGKGLGGSSSINGMVYIRGQPEDYDEWQQRGATGWGWSEMLPRFRKLEDHELGGSEERGTGGQVHVSTGKFRYPLAEALIEAGTQMGLPRKEDLNSGPREGVGYYLHNIRKGRRQSAAVAFLRPAMKRPNLKVVTGALVERVTIRDGRAAGVVAAIGGERREFATRGEVIVSAGAILSPKILQLSGIGPGRVLRDAGIAVIRDAPDVGRGYREHVMYTTSYDLVNDKGLNAQFRGIGLARSLLRYYLRRDGAMATGPYEVGAFVRSHAGVDRPDLQLYLGGFSFERGDDNFPVPVSAVSRRPGASVTSSLLRPTSEGVLSIVSPDPAADLRIDPHWMTTDADLRSAVAMVRYVRRYLSQPAIAPFIAREYLPGIADGDDDDDRIARAVRRHSTEGEHAVGSCRMGSDDRAVVDPRTRVRGIDGLRVVDCSIMPSLVSGNTNAPAMATGWRAADLILEEGRA